ncbi:unnamed protein product [Phytophthora lilii]|uniref:Unnamed protein product n=1 Tax=Phytophthora lilii TaxID=2077276 RepID=A0A9W6U041_9STRA|nr:unnamed protein product [Phytophthora lilii]
MTRRPFRGFWGQNNKIANVEELRFWDYQPLTADAGSVVLYYFPTAVHMLTVSAIITKIRSEVVRIGDDDELSETMLTIPSPTLSFGANFQMPDGALEPRQAFLHGLPNVVVHAAYTESWSHLEQKLRNYMIPTTAVQVAIGIKIFRTERRVMIFQRVDDHTFFEDVLDLSKIEPGSINIPVRTLYHGCSIPIPLVGQEDDEIEIGLNWLQGLINEFELRVW